MILKISIQTNKIIFTMALANKALTQKITKEEKLCALNKALI